MSKSEYQQAQGRAEAAEAKSLELAKLVEKLEKENSSLKETDQYFFNQATDLEAKGELQVAAEKYESIVQRFPAGALAKEAGARAEKLRAAIVEREKAATQAVAGLDAALGRQPDATSAVKLLDGLDEKYPLEKVRTATAKARERLRQQAEKEAEADQSARDLGIEISNIRTYWTIKRDVLGAQELAVPFVRFMVKNVGQSPLTKLHASAAFELVAKKELLGEGSMYAVGYGDPPLKPGYKKEVFFGSTVGYTGFGIFAGRPATTADIYIETEHGAKRLVKTIRVSPELNY